MLTWQTVSALGGSCAGELGAPHGPPRAVPSLQRGEFIPSDSSRSFTQDCAWNWAFRNPPSHQKQGLLAEVKPLCAGRYKRFGANTAVGGVAVVPTNFVKGTKPLFCSRIYPLMWIYPLIGTFFFPLLLLDVPGNLAFGYFSLFCLFIYLVGFDSFLLLFCFVMFCSSTVSHLGD